MKLLMVTREQAGQERFGIGKSLAALSDGLRDNGCSVEYLTRGGLQAEHPDLLRVETAAAARQLAPLELTRQPALANLIVGVVGVGRTAARLALQRGFDRVHVHDVLLAGGIRQISDEADAGSATLRWGVTQHSFGCLDDALHLHVSPVSPELRLRLCEWELRQMTRARWVCFPTRTGLERVVGDLGIESPAHWHVLPHPRPRINLYDRGVARRRLGWSTGEYRVLGVGMYLPVKRFDRLIQVCAGFGPELRLTLAGDGDASELRRQAAKSGLGDRLELVATDDIGLYLSASDLYVSTSYSESFGLANLEALIAGLPVIVSPVAAVPEVVGDAALQVDPEGPELAEAIKRLRDDAALRKRLRRKARARTAAWPDAGRIARRLLRLIDAGAGTDAGIDAGHEQRTFAGGTDTDA